MSIQNKPDYKIFAQDAKSGEIDTFPDILRGWGVTIDRTGEIPPMEWFNAIGKRVDEWLMYLTQRGVAEWDVSIDYPVSALVQYGDGYYVAIKNNKGDDPTTNSSSWSSLKKWMGVDGKLNTSDVTQSTGASTVKVMSQKAVTDALLAVPKNAALKGTEGWWKCGDTGLIIQWGRGKSGVDRGFPVTFPTACAYVQIIHGPNAKDTYTASIFDMWSSGFRGKLGDGTDFMFCAIGY